MLIDSIKHDLYRIHGNVSLKLFFKSYFLSPGFNYMVWFRITKKFSNPFVKYILYRKSVYFGIDIPYNTNISEGFYIGHFGAIVVNGKSNIGRNCNISQGVTIGQGNRGKNKGYPTIGNNCYIGPGVKIIGNVMIGNNVAIGANTVITKDTPDNAVVVGIPGKVISYDGVDGYINNKIEDMNNESK